MTPRQIKKSAVQTAVCDVLAVVHRAGSPHTARAEASLADLQAALVRGPTAEQAWQFVSVAPADKDAWRAEYEREWRRRLTARVDAQLRVRSAASALDLVQSLATVDCTDAEAVRTLQRLAASLV